MKAMPATLYSRPTAAAVTEALTDGHNGDHTHPHPASARRRCKRRRYSILVAAIAAIIVVLVFAIGTRTAGTYQTTCDNWNTAAGVARRMLT